MATLRICSWNVNGLRAGLRSGTFSAWLAESAPDIAGLQEVKARPEQVKEQPWLEQGYEATWHPAEDPGYSGALLLTKRTPASLRLGLETPEFEREGRVIEADFGEFVLLTSYFPNAGRKLARLDFKLAYYETFLERIVALREAGRSVVFMGDLNVAHAEDRRGPPKRAGDGLSCRSSASGSTACSPAASSTPSGRCIPTSTRPTASGTRGGSGANATSAGVSTTCS